MLSWNIFYLFFRNITLNSFFGNLLIRTIHTIIIDYNNLNIAVSLLQSTFDCSINIISSLIGRDNY